MTVNDLKREIVFLETLEEKQGLSKTAQLKLLWFRDALNYVNLPKKQRLKENEKE